MASIHDTGEGGVAGDTTVSRICHYVIQGLTLSMFTVVGQPKVKLAHRIVMGVIYPHDWEYFSNGVEVLIGRYLPCGISFVCKDPIAGVLGENMEKGGNIFNISEVGCYMHPDTELAPLSRRVVV